MIDRGVGWGCRVSVKESCKILGEGAKGVTVKECAICARIRGCHRVAVMEPVETGQGDGASERAIWAVDKSLRRVKKDTSDSG